MLKNMFHKTGCSNRFRAMVLFRNFFRKGLKKSIKTTKHSEFISCIYIFVPH